jgi:hypothetical protein
MWLLYVALTAVLAPIAWYGPQLVQSSYRASRRLATLQKLLRDDPERTGRPLLLAGLELDRRRLIDDYLATGNIDEAEALVSHDAANRTPVVSLVDGPTHVLTNVRCDVDPARYLQALRCAACSDRRYAGGALVARREPAVVDSRWRGGPVRVECACPEGHKQPDLEILLIVN